MSLPSAVRAVLLPRVKEGGDYFGLEVRDDQGLLSVTIDYHGLEQLHSVIGSVLYDADVTAGRIKSEPTLEDRWQMDIMDIADAFRV
jgi:hypothetical protein